MPSIITSAFLRSRFFSTRSSALALLWLKKRISGARIGVPAAKNVPSRMQAWLKLSRMIVVSLSASDWMVPTIAW